MDEVAAVETLLEKANLKGYQARFQVPLTIFFFFPNSEGKSRINASKLSYRVYKRNSTKANKYLKKNKL